MLLLSLLAAVGQFAATVQGLRLDGLLQVREEPLLTRDTGLAPRRFGATLQGISPRQSPRCKTDGYIPCEAYVSNRGCRPPTGTCCYDGTYCDAEYDCVVDPGDVKIGACCPRTTVNCADGKERECKTPGFSVCSELDRCCSQDTICDHNVTGGSQCIPVAIVMASLTSTLPTSSSTPTPSSTPTVAPQALSSSVNAGAIAGGVVGGVAVIALVVIFFFVWRKRTAVADTGRVDAQHGQTGQGGTNSSAPGSKLNPPPLVTGLGYSSPSPNSQGPPSYMGVPVSTHSASAPGSPPMTYAGLGATTGQFPGTGYHGAPEVHDAGGPLLTNPAQRFSVLSENSNASGAGGFYYNAAPTGSAAAAFPSGGGFNPALTSPTTSPTSQQFSYQSPTGPVTPLSANSEQGMLYAQSHGYPQGQGSATGRRV